MKSMWDAAHPPATPPQGFDAAAGYIGGDTPHVWTQDEWHRLGRLPKLPIWVQSAPATGHPENEAMAALQRLYQIGCPRGSAVALDLEMAVHTGFVNAFGNVMHWAGFRVWVYGSRSTVLKNPPLDGYWVADYLVPRAVHMVPGAKVRATQWTDNVTVPGGTIDKSVVKWWSWRWRLWR